MAGKLPDSNKPVLFFDGVCNLCNGFVQKIIRNDKKGLFMFSSLQSDTGAAMLEYIGQQGAPAPDSLILLHEGKYYTRSDAALMTAKLLGGAWKLFLVGYIAPRPIRDRIYDLVARNRYKWFGKQDNCMIPTPELKARFLD